jgi:hypothetical protein
MLDVPLIHYFLSIRMLHLRGFSERAIAKMLGVNRRTVHRYLTEEEVVEPRPRMRRKTPRPSPKMDPWKAIVAQWVEEDRSVPASSGGRHGGNPGAGNEKGGVESLVGWAQRNLFSPIPGARSFAEMHARLRQQLLDHAATTKLPDGTRIQERWEAEQRVRTPLPKHPFPACRTCFVHVDKMLLCPYDGARYSVPPQYVGKPLTLKAFWDPIELEDRGTLVAVHARQPKGGVSLKLEHDLPVLAHKPRAVRHAMVITRGEPEIARYRDAFLAARPEAYRELIAILRLAETIGL